MEAFVIKSFSSLLIIILMTSSVVVESLHLGKTNGKTFCWCILTEPIAYLIMFEKNPVNLLEKEKGVLQSYQFGLFSPQNVVLVFRALAPF